MAAFLTSPPSTTMFGELNDELLVFVLGTEHALWVRARAGNSWREWETLGHTLASPPSAVTWQHETSAVFALGLDSAVWGVINGEWQSLAGSWAAAPFALAGRPPHPCLRDRPRPHTAGGLLQTRDLAALGVDHTIWHMNEDDT